MLCEARLFAQACWPVDRRGRQVFYVVGDPHIRSMLTDMVDHVAEGGETEIIEGG